MRVKLSTQDEDADVKADISLSGSASANTISTRLIPNFDVSRTESCFSFNSATLLLNLAC